MTIHPLDVVVLTRDLPDQQLRRGDLGAVVAIYGPEAIGVEFVAASGRTQALVRLKPQDLRPVADDDLVAVRPTGSTERRVDSDGSRHQPAFPPVFDVHDEAICTLRNASPQMAHAIQSHDEAIQAALHANRAAIDLLERLFESGLHD